MTIKISMKMKNNNVCDAMWEYQDDAKTRQDASSLSTTNKMPQSTIHDQDQGREKWTEGLKDEWEKN